MSTSDGFTVVVHKRGRSRPLQRAPLPVHEGDACSRSHDAPTEHPVSRRDRRAARLALPSRLPSASSSITAAFLAWRDTAALSSLLTTLTSFLSHTAIIPPCEPRVICLGLGSLALGSNSTQQLALLLHLRDAAHAAGRAPRPHHHVDRDGCATSTVACDPAFTGEDEALLAAHGVRVQVVDDPTPLLPCSTSTVCTCRAVVYMPHCGDDLNSKWLHAAARSSRDRRACTSILISNSVAWYATTRDVRRNAEWPDCPALQVAAAAGVKRVHDFTPCSDAASDAVALCELSLPMQGLSEAQYRALDATSVHYYQVSPRTAAAADGTAGGGQA